MCYPLDTIRRKMMMQAESNEGERLYGSGLDCARKVLRSEGVRGFYPGIGVNVARGVSGALLLIGYDEIKAMLHS
jgi:solute carrier family 25 (mitochondrial adenine nucleotide translocator), member 4/5/6/31